MSTPNAALDQLTPGVFGVSHGSGLGGELIRHATASWAGHAFVYVGGGRIVEGTPPAAQLADARKYDDAVWAWRMPVTPVQSAAVEARAHALVGTPYDWPAYVGFALEVLKLRSEAQLDPVFKSDRWRVCSALVADCYQYAGIPLAFPAGPETTVNLVSPAMLYDLAAREGWT